MRALVAVAVLLVACGDSAAPTVDDVPDVTPDVAEPDVPDTPEPLALRVVTFNTGTGGGSGTGDANAGYGAEQSAWSDEHYGNGLAWSAIVDQTRAWFDATDPDLVAFQEIFWSGDCPDVPAEARAGFVCETWSEGDPTVAELALGPDYQVACHPEKPDKCLAVHGRLGAFEGCDGALCLDGLDGFQVPDCGSGARVARGQVALADGGTLTVVSFHGTSGYGDEEIACRVAQVEQVFVDLGDGAPGASGDRNIVLGDLNTDPARLADGDASAARWNDFVGDGLDFHWVSDVGEDAPPTYAALVNIDHVAADAFTGSCVVPGVTDGEPPVTDAVVFDHRPVVCDVVDASGEGGE